MIKIARIWSLLTVLALALATAAVAEKHDQQDREGGLTGTGIIGEVTALGSIIVNGKRITFAPDMPVASALGITPARDLQPGDVVAAVVRATGDGYEALSLSQILPVIGPVSSASPRALVVMGTRITLETGHSLKPGDWVAVSGFWNRDVMAATRVIPLPPRETAVLQGSFLRPAPGTPPRLGGTTLAGMDTAGIENGAVLRVIGRPAGPTLRVEASAIGLFDRPLGLILAEGYLSAVATSGHYTLSGSGISAVTPTPEVAMTRQRLRTCGLGGRLIDTLAPLPPRETGRATALGCFDGGTSKP